MQERNDQVGWTDAQWNRIRQIVNEEAIKARVAASFLPIYGSVPPGTQVVPSERLNATDWTVDDAATTPLLEIERKITLSQSQVREEDLSSALLLFRSAANVLARLEDWSIFNGRPYLFGDPARAPDPAAIPGPIEVKGGEKLSWGEMADQRIDQVANQYLQDLILALVEKRPDATKQAVLQQLLPALNLNGAAALATLSDRMRNRLLMTSPGGLGLIEGASLVITEGVLDSDGLIRAILQAITDLEAGGHPKPFVCVLGARAFQVATVPPRAAPGTLVLPRDRIEPILGSELLRSSVIDDRINWVPPEPAARGLVISIAGDSMDLVRAVDVTPEFLRIDERGRYEFRVYERFALRIKRQGAIASLEFTALALP
jgi:uncharacterized linocin/CFP29 family protein